MSVKRIRSDRPVSRTRENRKTGPNRKKKTARPLRIPGLLKIWGPRVAAVPLLALGLLFMHDLLTQSRYFRIRAITVLGGEVLKEKDILDQAAIPAGSNLLALHLRHVRLRLEAHPWIRSATLTRKLPDVLEISVREETPFAVLTPSAMPEAAFWADSSGRIFKEVENGDPTGYPRIQGLPFGDPPNRQQWFLRAKTLLDLLAEMQDPVFTGMTPPVLGVDPDLGLGLYETAIATRILFGFSDFREKNARLRTLLRHRRERGQTGPMDTIDLVRPDRVVVIPAAA